MAKQLTPTQLKKADEHIDDMQMTYQQFVMGERPQSLSEYKEANKMAKKFHKLYAKYNKKSILSKLPTELLDRFNDIDPDEVYEFD